MHALHSLKKDASRITRWFHQARPVRSVSREATGRVLRHSFLARALLDRKLCDYMGRPAGRDFYSVFQSSLSSRHLASEPHACNCGNPLEQILMRGCSQRIWISVLGWCVRMASLLGKNNYQPQMRANLCKGREGSTLSTPSPPHHL